MQYGSEDNCIFQNICTQEYNWLVRSENGVGYCTALFRYNCLAICSMFIGHIVRRVSSIDRFVF